MKLVHLYLEDGLTSPADFLHMRISSWYKLNLKVGEN